MSGSNAGSEGKYAEALVVMQEGVAIEEMGLRV